MSMPSSRLLVATTAGSRPDLRSSSMVARCSLLTEPWWARASTAGAPREAPDWAMTCGGAAGERRRRAARHPARVHGVGAASAASTPLLPDLVEPGGEPLGEPAAVGEHQGRGVLGDEVDDALLDVRPDRGALLLPGRRPAEVAGGLAELGHVGHRHDDLEVPLLGRGRLHDVDRTAAGEVAGDLFDGSDGGGQPDSLRRALEVGVEPLEARGPGGHRAWCRPARAPRRG